MTTPRSRKVLPHPSTRKPRGPATGKEARIAAFARLWVGTISGTLKLCRAEGLSICEDTASSYLRDPRFIDKMADSRPTGRGSGIWKREELQRFFTRIAAGLEPDGLAMVNGTERIIPGEDDYNLAKGGVQHRAITKEVPRPARMCDRLKAADSLGKTLGAFMERLELTGDAKISVVDLLDDDLRHAKSVSGVTR